MANKVFFSGNFISFLIRIKVSRKVIRLEEVYKEHNLAKLIDFKNFLSFDQPAVFSRYCPYALRPFSIDDSWFVRGNFTSHEDCVKIDRFIEYY